MKPVRCLKRVAQRWLGGAKPEPVHPNLPLPLVPQVATTFETQPDWRQLLHEDWPRWEAAVKAAEHGPPVLIATSTGGAAAFTIVESALAVALTLRGARVHVLLCDAALPACMMAMVHELPAEELISDAFAQRLCRACFPAGNALFLGLELPVHRYSDFLTTAERSRAARLARQLSLHAIRSFRLDEIAVGEQALAGALRFFASGDLGHEPLAEPVLRRYFEASLLTTYAMQRLLRGQAFESVCFHHGIYVPQGLVGAVARQQGVRVINWNAAYRAKCFIFSHDDTYHHTLLDEPVAAWENLPWTPEMENDILQYLMSRWQGTNDWIWFHEKPQEELAAIAAELGIDFSRPCVGMLTNVMWDAQLHYPANAFPDMLDWTVRTIEYFGRRPDLQLIIRIHPAEIRGTLRSRQPLLAEIQSVFPVLPGNVIIIPPESQVSTYAVMVKCDSVIIYGTKMGVELASLGIPVIVAGEAWIRNKGLTLDARSPEEYFSILDRLPLNQRMDAATTRRARQYAYHFFLRRMIPLDMMTPTGAWPPFRLELEGLDSLAPGRGLGLDTICDGILNGTPFIYPFESVGQQARR